MGIYDEPVMAGFDRAWEQNPEKTAVIFLGEKYSYDRLRNLIKKFATELSELGVRDNDKVMLYIPNCPQFLIGYFGAQMIGAIPVPVSPIYTPHEIKYLINDSGAETVLCQDTNVRYIKEVLPATCLKRTIITNLVDLLPAYKKMIGFLFDRVPKGVTEKGEGVYFFKKLVDKFPADPPVVDFNPREHLSYIHCTGGTTGFPKGCIASHTGMVSFVNDIREIGEGFISDGQDVFIMVNPLFHQMAQGIILGMVLTRGNTAVLMPIPQVDPILHAIQKYKGSLFLGAPTLYRMILENDRVDWNKPEETASSYVEIDEKIWYRTKDFVKIDETGQPFYVDRSADVIKHKGYRISCSEIEAVLQDHPAVIGACVVGVPDAKVGKLLRREIRDEERRRIDKEKKTIHV